MDMNRSGVHLRQDERIGWVDLLRVVVFSGGVRTLLRSVRCPVRSGSGLVSDRGILRKSGPFERAVVRYDDGRPAAARAEGYGRFLPETDRPDHRSVDLLVDRPADSVFCLFELYSAAQCECGAPGRWIYAAGNRCQTLHLYLQL